jgi:hypothetical protein
MPIRECDAFAFRMTIFSLDFHLCILLPVDRGGFGFALAQSAPPEARIPRL